MDEQFTNLDSEPELWYACAGPSVQIPPANSLVYYFIQGHLEHCYKSADRAIISPLFAKSLQYRILCKVDSVALLADPATDHVFAKFRLIPLQYHKPIKPDESLYQNPTPDEMKRYPEAPVRECLQRLINLPPITPYYTIRYDLHSVPRLFECIRFRGRADKVHVGRSWGELLIEKKVEEGDTILLMKDRAGVERFGILRKTRRAYNKCPGTISAAVAAIFNMPFDVYYYPRLNIPAFVVNAARVEAAMRTPWQVGRRFSMQSEDKVKGTISSIEDVDHENWPYSQWRRIKVIMDSPDSNQHEIRFNPWMLRLEAKEERSRNDLLLPPKKRNMLRLSPKK